MRYQTILSTAVLLFSLIVTQSANCQEPASSAADFVAEMDEKIPAWLEEFIVPGAAIAVIEDGEIILQKGYGYADVDEKVEVDVQTGFNIASISKTVAAWGVMDLVEEGKLELDAPAEKYLSRWHLPESEFDVKGVTIRRLLSHTAGLSLHGYPGFTPNDTLPTIEESLSGKTNGAGGVKQIREPGSGFRYSGGGYTLLQLIVEEVSGQSFAEYMQANVLDPLGMTNSSYTIDERIMKASSKEHDSYGEEIPFELFTAEAAAGLHTTIADMSRFALVNLRQPGADNPVLEASTMEMMIAPADEAEGDYGLGYGRRRLPGSDESFFGHGGSNSGWQAILQMNGGTKRAFIMFTNGATGRAVLDQAYGDWVEWGWSVDMSAFRRKPIVPLLVRAHKAKGMDEAIAQYREAKESDSDTYYFNEWDINLYGYQLLWADKLDDAIEIFKLNIAENPYSANPYDSYGEALLAKGDTVAAIDNYKRSMELDPRNDNGRQVLEKLGVHVAPYVEPVSILDAPDDWGSEIIPFPIGFAPTIDLKGYEELRFAPGWRDSTSQNLWTLMFVWYVEGNEDLSKENISTYLEAYYDGLADVEYRKDQGAENTRCQLMASKDGMQGTIRAFDSFVRNEMMTLNVKVEQGHCSKTDKHLIRFQISPKEFNDPVWDSFGDVEVTVDCE